MVSTENRNQNEAGRGGGRGENKIIHHHIMTESHHIDIARHHFEQKGYRTHSGLQFGCELLLTIIVVCQIAILWAQMLESAQSKILSFSR